MVLTAGHCIFGGPQFDNSGNQPRNWYYNWIYIPGYYVYNGLGFAPYGIWNAWEIASTAPWIGYADTSQDVGMALMVHNSSGYALTTIVGGQGLTWDLPVGQQVTDYGYPVNPTNPSAPAGLQSCSAPIYRYGGTGPYADITCAMAAPGASGGPWLAFQDAWGMGLVGGLNSFIWPGTNFVFSPWFSQYVYNMYASLATV